MKNPTLSLRARLACWGVVGGFTLGCAGPPATRTSSALEPDPCGPSLGFTETRGGRGGTIVRVTSLAAAGPGSLAEALAHRGRRLVVFEVGGVIDLAGAVLRITEPEVSVAGQTAPHPGITLIRGGVSIRTHDVVLQHIRVRPGTAGKAKRSGWEVDGINTSTGAHDVIVDHCSLSWATDENLTASGERFYGPTPETWRAGTTHRVTFSNNIVGEGLSKATHLKGEHSKGTLIHDNVTDAAVVRNLFLSNVERSPLFKGGARGIVVNNWIVNPGESAVKYGLVQQEWNERPQQTGQMAVVGNAFSYGPNTQPNVPLLLASGDGPCEVYLHGNSAIDRERRPVPLLGGATQLLLLQDQPPVWPSRFSAIEAAELPARLAKEVGARPWDRDKTDQRLVNEALASGGTVIDSEREVEGYPRVSPTRVPFDPTAWDLECLVPRGPTH